MKKILLVCVGMAFIGGCATAGRVNDGIIGMEMMDVRAKLGQPAESAVRDGHLYWAYKYRSWDEYAIAPICLGLNLLVTDPKEIRVLRFEGSKVDAWGNPEFFGFHTPQPYYAPPAPEVATQPQQAPGRFNCSSRMTASGRMETDCQNGGRYESH